MLRLKEGKVIALLRKLMTKFPVTLKGRESVTASNVVGKRKREKKSILASLSVRKENGRLFTATNSKKENEKKLSLGRKQV